MKRVFLITMLGLLTLGYSQTKEKEVTIGSNVTTEEYNKLSDDEKRFVDLLNAATATVKGFYITDNMQSYEADIHFSTNEKDIVRNSITFSKVENDAVFEKKNSCRVCGLRSAYSCLEKIRSTTQGQTEFDVHVRNDGDCVVLTW